MQFRLTVSFSLIVLTGLSGTVDAADWPMWRHDANRSGASPHTLPKKLHLQWSRQYRSTATAWPDQAKMQFDIAREPVVGGQTIYFNSSRYDAVRALDTRTGDEKWTFFADGPIRFAPALGKDRLYFVSDDGYLYCLKAETGKLLWRFRGGPGDRKILGNDRLISTWPARGAPVLADGNVYFAASIWPFMGIFIHAVDADTGKAVWTNDGDGSVYMKQPHNSDSFAGVAPQGPLVAIGDRLLIPGGRSIPACFDRKTGKMLRYQLAENGKRGGGSEVAAIGTAFFNGGAVFDLEAEKFLNSIGTQFVLTEHTVFTCDKGACRALDLENAEIQKGFAKDAKGKKTKVTRWTMPELAVAKGVDVETMMLAGNRLYLGAPNRVTMLDWDAGAKQFTQAGELDVPGTVARLIAADDRLFAVTREGGIYCFGGERKTPMVNALPKIPFSQIAPAVKSRVEDILTAAKTRAGYAVVWGVGDGQLVEALARQSDLHVIVVEADAKKVQSFRSRWTATGLYGPRIAIVPGTAELVQLPPYFASVMIFPEADAVEEKSLVKAYQSLRPFGGSAHFLDAPDRTVKMLTRLADSKLTSARVGEYEKSVVLVRTGALPGSANWTHEHADAANTRVSRDVRVKAPMGVLWFGGPSHDVILPRHGHGPQPQVVDGRMIIEGVDLMRAIDIYTGRLLWETKLPGVGRFYNNVAHQPGANAAGTNFVSTPEGIYVAYQSQCVRLDPETGKKIAFYTLPNTKEPTPWGYLNVVGDYLIGGADPLFDPKFAPPALKKGFTGDDEDPKDKNKDDKTSDKKAAKESAISKLLKAFKGNSDNMSGSRRLVVLDRRTGKVLWTATAKHSFRHNAICVGGGRLYAIDRLSGHQIARLKKEDDEVPAAHLTAFDLKTGKQLWTTDADVFGTWLSYSEKHDVLIEAGRVARDSLFDEPKGMRAYRARDGGEIWFNKSYTGPGMIHGDTVLQGQGACDLLTGALKMRKDPLTGEAVPWKWTRNYGCNTPAASEHLMTFRSGAAGYFDLCNDSGTGNFGGFRSSCTNNLIVAGGVLTAPEYTRTCTCAYQNQSSIGLIHMPDAEMWTSFGSKDVKGSIRRLGLNLGAAGDRKVDNGTLWLEYPSVGGISPAIKVTTTPAKPAFFRRHSSAIDGAYAWVTSSGMKGAGEICISLGKMTRPQAYTVKLYFAEPDGMPAGKRRFHVEVEGRRVLTDFDIAKEAGGPARSLVKEFTGVTALDVLRVRLIAANSEFTPVICGIELVAENKK
ncbi:MAG: PQQ-binding-like beta-propeller repeat protein [Planctomycetes bacterium]|nr:PQQ-binding-like beta-propeller repeat protein [Planctomycetota bacterium]